LESVLQESWYQVRTVLTEELLCRGALLYILIRRIGRRNAVVVSSVLFALLHWMNAGVFGNLTQMILVFSFTFMMGLLLAYAYARTFSIHLPFAIHFGWNYVQNFVFPDSASGQHLFMLAAPPPEVTISYLAFYTMLMVPKLLVLVLNYLIVRQHPEMKMP
ncbi:MAG TPA: CPBP family intramembrane metalloprotease, partial [Bacteroidia bacterium]|nr:CPBP family intramembrane metalloprotease [Bacteroidia bacterium]